MRNQDGSNWIVKATIFSLSTTVAGLVSGFVLGFAGNYVRVEIRLAAVSAFSLAGIIIAILHLGGRRFQPFQCNRETPQSWVHTGPIQWAIQNGLALGSGFANRIGFWLWYVIPLGSFFFGQAEFGALLYGLYGFVRGMMVWVLIYLPDKNNGEDLAERLIGYNEVAQLITTGHLLVMSVIVAVAIGL